MCTQQKERYFEFNRSESPDRDINTIDPGNCSFSFQSKKMRIVRRNPNFFFRDNRRIPAIGPEEMLSTSLKLFIRTMAVNTLGRFYPYRTSFWICTWEKRIRMCRVHNRQLGIITPLSTSSIQEKRYQHKIAPLSLEAYHKLSEESLQQLQSWLEHLLDLTTIREADIEYAMGVLTLRLGPDGTYVFNKQPPNRQLWLSSPIR